MVPWDGDPAGWCDYARKVRLQHEETPKYKRRYLAPDLASRLTGRAWAVTPDLDHNRLNKRNGAKYLLSFLQCRLCRTAVPDAGARLEDLLIRLRRPLFMSMSQWSNEVLEAYRKVQRAVVRARQQRPGKELSEVKSPVSARRAATDSEPQAEPPSPVSHPTRTPRRTRPPSEGDVPGSREEPQWSELEWAWRRQWYGHGWKSSSSRHHDEESSSGEDVPWDGLEVEDPQVLPDEVLGWLLLRRANLSADMMLSVQASVQNSLRFQDIELALRDQEEELMQADHHRQDRGPRCRTFWVVSLVG